MVQQKKPRKAEKVKIELPDDCWWLNYDENGDTECMVYTTNLKKSIKLKDVKEFCTYHASPFHPAFARQFSVSTESPSFKKLLDEFELTESDRKKDYEIPKRKRRKSEEQV